MQQSSFAQWPATLCTLYSYTLENQIQDTSQYLSHMVCTLILVHGQILTNFLLFIALHQSNNDCRFYRLNLDQFV